MDGIDCCFCQLVVMVTGHSLLNKYFFLHTCEVEANFAVFVGDKHCRLNQCLQFQIGKPDIKFMQQKTDDKLAQYNFYTSV